MFGYCGCGGVGQEYYEFDDCLQYGFGDVEFGEWCCVQVIDQCCIYDQEGGFGDQCVQCGDCQMQDFFVEGGVCGYFLSL